MSGPLLNLLDNVKEQAKDALWALSSCLCQQSASVKINGRSYKIIKVLGEGGFSFVYLAQDETSGRQFALKKIRCPTGAEGVREAMREVEAYRRFRHPNIIRILDSAVVQDSDGEGQIVYLFLPLYSRGNLQDAINTHSLNGTYFSENDILKYFKGTCEAVRAMHTFYAPVKKGLSRPNGSAAGGSGSEPHRVPQPQAHTVGDDSGDDDDEHNQMLPEPEGDDEGGFSYDGPPSARGVPLLTKKKAERGEVIFDGDQELADSLPAPDGEGELVPFAHRDLKPGNVMISDDGVTPILMDFGSTVRARIKIETRSQALMQQDLAAEQSTMAYRAPELFDVQTGSTLDERVDIWSLGCVLYALAYLHSPFETPQTMDQGGSIAMAVLNAQYKHPSGGIYSEGLKNLIDSLLISDPASRPDIHKVIELTDAALRNVS